MIHQPGADTENSRFTARCGEQRGPPRELESGQLLASKKALGRGVACSSGSNFQKPTFQLNMYL